MENAEENCEMIGKIWKKPKLKSEKLENMEDFCVRLVTITPKETSSSSSSSSSSSLYTLFFRIEKNHPEIVFFLLETLRLFSTSTVAVVKDYLEYIANISENTVGENHY